MFPVTHTSTYIAQTKVRIHVLMLYNAMHDILKQYFQEKLESFETSPLTPNVFANFYFFECVHLMKVYEVKPTE